ncbi:MAG: hypothetical protein, partial [Olavius algarvensis Gamma 1 endosymbiont]
QRVINGNKSIVLPPVPTWIQATPSPLWHATMIHLNLASTSMARGLRCWRLGGGIRFRRNRGYFSVSWNRGKNS